MYKCKGWVVKLLLPYLTVCENTHTHMCVWLGEQVMPRNIFMICIGNSGIETHHTLHIYVYIYTWIQPYAYAKLDYISSPLISRNTCYINPRQPASTRSEGNHIGLKGRYSGAGRYTKIWMITYVGNVQSNMYDRFHCQWPNIWFRCAYEINHNTRLTQNARFVTNIYGSTQKWQVYTKMHQLSLILPNTP